MAKRIQNKANTTGTSQGQRGKTTKARSKTTRNRPSRSNSRSGIHLPDINLSANSAFLHNDTVINILCILLIAISAFGLFSLLTIDRNHLPGLIVTTLFNAFGLGIYLVPVMGMVCGLWLLFRKTGHMPDFNSERFFGMVLLALNIMSFLHLLLNGGWNDLDAQTGGGYIGAFFALALKSALGKPASFIIIGAWLLISLDVLIDISTYDLFRLVTGPLDPLRKQFLVEWNQWKREMRARINGDDIEVYKTVTDRSGEPLPTDFQPLPQNKGAVKNARKGQPEAESAEPEKTDHLPEVIPEARTNWTLPTIEAILDPVDTTTITGTDHKERAQLIEETLTSFGAPGRVVEVHSGPTVTMYGVEPDLIETRSGKMRVRVSKISSLADDLALALAAPRIRIQAPVPGRNFVGIEVPNTHTNRVTLRELLESQEFQNIRSPLRFALGKDVSGNSVAADLRDMPHLLVAGTTGSGKSVCVNTILCSFLLNNSPVDLRLILVDPKRVELSGYNRIPHLLAPVIVDADRVVGALQWVLREMDNRYHKFTRAGVRNIIDFNTLQPEGEYLPHLVVVIDELADLMMLAPDETEKAITRLAQLARATGIHMIIATQRPSVDVVTGLIKANFPARIAFAVASSIDSRVIIDQPGAERLLGRGDMLFMPPDSPAPIRLQGAFVSDSEIQLLVDYWKYNAADSNTQTNGPIASSVDAVPVGVPLHQAPLWEEKVTDPGDAYLSRAIEIAKTERRASITMLQRKLRIGYTRAARLIDTLEDQGIISPAQGTSQLREYIGTDEDQASPEDEPTV